MNNLGQMRPHVTVSLASSLDGYIDDASPERLILSSPEDWHQVDLLRARSDAILVGANTVRRDDPRLRIKDQELAEARIAHGKPRHPLRVVITASGEIREDARIFGEAADEVLFVCPQGSEPKIAERFGASLRTIVAGAGRVDMPLALDRLGELGIRRLLIEGGATIVKEVIELGLADEIRLALAPFVLGDADGISGLSGFLRRIDFRLQTVERVGNMAVLILEPR